MKRRQNVPPWAKVLLQHMLRPPYFLEQIASANAQKSSASQEAKPKSHKETENRAADEDVGGHSFVEGQPVHPRPDGRSETHSSRHTAASGRPAQPYSHPHARHEGTIDEELVTTSLPNVELTGPAWRRVLRRLDIPPELPKAYGWSVKRAEAVGGVARVITPSRVYAVKRTHLSPEGIRCIYELANYVRIHGFPLTPRFALTKKPRRPFFSRDGQPYYATRWVVGNPANFSRIEQVAAVSRALARFHKASRGFEPQSGGSLRSEFNLEGLCKRRLSDLRVLLLEAEQRKARDRFAQRLCDLGPTLRRDAEAALALLAEADVRAHLYREEEDPCVCHLDVTPDNFIYTPNHDVAVLDLDLAAYAPRALDVAHLLRRSLERQRWSGDVAYRCFLEFDKVQSMTKAEYTLVRALLTFPYRAWRLAHAHLRLQPRPDDLADLEDFAQQQEQRQHFLEAFAEQIQQV
ncbi:phosphotransferase [Alicyclobacillus herbarius]|uniref:phosphotransferase n=1 Tax=Alicyclobacillus herbarius TaxID=122960 RepID=UPI0012DD5045|nr:phosphotransferase [Alicyclobacillus herbarius]